MSKHIILFVALESELSLDKIPEGVNVYYTGVGKVNAAIKATEILNAYKFGGWRAEDAIVLNYGSAGSNTIPKGTLAKCKHFIQNDMNTPFCPNHGTPFDELLNPELKEAILDFGSGFVCRTQDKFEDNPVGIFDMEAYSIAKVCKLYGFNFTAYKYISDGGDANDWEANHAKGAELFLEKLNKDYL
jgi:adenosylhomocysteine nucleosidase